MRRKLPVLMPMAMALAALVAGCGGGDDSSGFANASEPVTTSSLTKAEFIKQANAVCTRGRDDREAKTEAFAEDNRDQSEAELIAAVTQDIYLPGKEDELAELRELGAPRGEEKQIEAIIVAFEKAFTTMSQLEGSQDNPTFNKQLNRAGELAREYKLIECTYG